jgi:hypothetical protein
VEALYKNLHKITEQISYYDLSCIYAFSVLMIFVAKSKLIFELYFWE